MPDDGWIVIGLVMVGACHGVTVLMALFHRGADRRSRWLVLLGVLPAIACVLLATGRLLPELSRDTRFGGSGILFFSAWALTMLARGRAEQVDIESHLAPVVRRVVGPGSSADRVEPPNDLSGWYQGRRITVSMRPGATDGTSGPDFRVSIVVDRHGDEPWDIRFTSCRGKCHIPWEAHWKFKTKDPGLQQRLYRAGLLDVLADCSREGALGSMRPCCGIRYRPGDVDATLESWMCVCSEFHKSLTAEALESQVRCLIEVARVNAEANAPLGHCPASTPEERTRRTNTRE